jgi:hypothetical protein
MLLLLGIALLVQSQPMSPPVQRLSERIYYAHPYQRGVFSCNRRTAERQQHEFERRFGLRIATLKRKDLTRWGPDPGFEAIALGHCSRDTAASRARFEAALREFSLDLSAMEREYP